MSRDTSVAVLFALALVSSSCGSVVPAASPLELGDAAAAEAAREPDAAVAAEASADDTSSSHGAERGDAGAPEVAASLPFGPCAGLINPPPTTIVPCSSTCATCTSSTEAFEGCRLDGAHWCVRSCSDCP